MKYTRLFLAIAIVTLSHPAAAENWTQWRGPNHNGSTGEKNPPTKWTKDSVAWSVDLPGPSAATPVIWNDLVFLSTADTETKTTHAWCLDRKTGKVLWHNKTGDGLAYDDKSNFAAPSPVTDADRVFFFYGNGPLVAFDHAGKQLWSRDITKDFGSFAFQWTFSASPMLYEGRLYLEILQRDVPVHGRGKPGGPIESFVLAVDPADGKTLWRQVRPSDAIAESHEAYSTPIPFEYKGRKEILIVGGDCVTGHDPKTGEELWRWGTYNPHKIGHWRLVPSPVTGGGVILVCAPKGDPIYAIKAGGKGALDDSAIAWKSDKKTVSADVPTPLFYDSDFFVLNESKKNISRVDPATGTAKWTLDLPGFHKFEASPTAADGKLFLMNFGGEVLVVDASKGEIVSNIPMGESGDDETRSSIAISHGQLFIRTNHKLFCVGGK